MTGAELTAMRKSAGFLAKDLAKELGINPTTLSRYEHDKLPITPMVEYAARYVCEIAIRQMSMRHLLALMEVLDR